MDVSHIADKTFYHVGYQQSARDRFALIMSRVMKRRANMTDDMIKALAAKGGVIQINYHVG